jgi:hypothetical protein
MNLINTGNIYLLTVQVPGASGWAAEELQGATLLDHARKGVQGRKFRLYTTGGPDVASLNYTSLDDASLDGVPLGWCVPWIIRSWDDASLGRCVLSGTDDPSLSFLLFCSQSPYSKKMGTYRYCHKTTRDKTIHRQALDRQALERQTLDTTNPGHDKPWTRQTLDRTNPGHDKPWIE